MEYWYVIYTTHVKWGLSHSGKFHITNDPKKQYIKVAVYYTHPVIGKNGVNNFGQNTFSGIFSKWGEAANYFDNGVHIYLRAPNGEIKYFDILSLKAGLTTIAIRSKSDGTLADFYHGTKVGSLSKHPNYVKNLKVYNPEDYKHN